MRNDLPRGTVTFLFTDIEGSTRLLHALGPDGYATALATHRDRLRAAFDAHHGVEVDTQGDAFFVAFPTAEGAASAARAATEALAAGPTRVRMGIHTGAPTLTPEGYVGIDVHRGARVAALAHGGQIVVSPATAALLDGVQLIDLGLHRLKDFEEATRLFQLGAGDFPVLRTPGAVDLPTPATSFLGRERELFDAIAVVLERDPRVLTVLGPGGTGKTRFAIELARLLAEEAEGATLFVPLAPLREHELVLATIAEALGADGPDPTAVAARIGDRRTHLVVDNVEHLLPEAANVLAAVVEAAPALRLIVTSREALRIGAEEQVDLPPLAADEAVGLFLTRAHAVRPDIERTPAVDQLCERLDRLPLAIELAAARTKLLTPEAVLDRLGARLDLPAPRDAEPRHATLRTTIEWSHDLLDDRERLLFARLAVFRGGCTLEAAEDVCGADLVTLASLLDKRLLRRGTAPDGTERFWMLETIHEFAADRLGNTAEASSLRRAHAQALIDLAERAELRPPDDGSHRDQGLDVAAAELDNVRAALTWAVEEDPTLGLDLGAALEEFWVVREPVEGALWLQRLLGAAGDAPPELRAQAWRALAGAREIFGDPEAAAPAYRTSLELYEQAGNESAAINLRLRIGINLANRNDLAAARPALEQALTHFRRLRLRAGEAQALGTLGMVADLEGDLDTAVELRSESAEIAHELGWTWWEQHELLNLSHLERRRGSPELARRHAEAGLAIATRIGDRMASVFAAAELSNIAAMLGQPSRAGLLWGAVEAEEAVAPVGQFPRYRSRYESELEQAAGPAFEAARLEGRLLTLAQAAASPSA